MNTLKSFLLLIVLLYSSVSSVSSSYKCWDYKLPNEIGNLFKDKNKKDRQYGKAEQLLKDVYAEGTRSEKYYSYDEVGNLIKKESITDKWSQSGMLKKVIRPDKKHVDFTYDALGRRLELTIPKNLTT